jgi:ketopantoate reductase
MASSPHTLGSQVTEAAKDAALILRENGCIVTTQNGVAAPAQASAAVGSEASVLVGIAKVRLLETCFMRVSCMPAGSTRMHAATRASRAPARARR